MVGKWNGQKLYKGAAAGTHWWATDARIDGFTVGASVVGTPAVALTHITNYSFPSPYVSLSTSFAVAWKYATMGPVGSASAGSHGYVYEIDTMQAPCSLVDPVELISGAWLCQKHDGEQTLILAVASPATYPDVLITPPRRLGSTPPFAPQISQELQGLVWAIRDAEVFACSVPRKCVVNRHPAV
jgi:hypothetical protein